MGPSRISSLLRFKWQFCTYHINILWLGTQARDVCTTRWWQICIGFIWKTMFTPRLRTAAHAPKQEELLTSTKSIFACFLNWREPSQHLKRHRSILRPYYRRIGHYHTAFRSFSSPTTDPKSSLSSSRCCAAISLLRNWNLRRKRTNIPNGTTKMVARMLHEVFWHQADWDTYIQLLTYACNNQVYLSTGFKTFQLFSSIIPQDPIWWAYRRLCQHTAQLKWQ